MKNAAMMVIEKVRNLLDRNGAELVITAQLQWRKRNNLHAMTSLMLERIMSILYYDRLSEAFSTRDDTHIQELMYLPESTGYYVRDKKVLTLAKLFHKRLGLSRYADWH